MKRRALLALMMLVAAVVVFDVARPEVSAEGAADERIRFQITAVVEKKGVREVVSDAAVEGPPGTDFNVNLQDGRFKVSARFMSDLAPGGGLKLRAKLDTRRLYGESEAGLPLYEEDEQRHTLGLGFDEAVVLLPFGSGGGSAGRLSIEITPARTGRPARLPSGETTAPEITIDRPSPGGVISIEATKVPHDYRVEATLLEDGREAARGSADALLEEASRLTLRRDDGSAPLALDLKVERYEAGSGSGRAAVRFDVSDGEAAQHPLARNWAGVAGIGSELSYDLTHVYGAASGKRYELKLKVNLKRPGAAEPQDRRRE